MRSDVLIVARAGQMPRLECTGGVAARRTDTDTVHLVSTAATPLGGDVIEVRVVVEAGARLRVRTAAATMVLPGRDTVESHAQWELDVAGELDLDPQPTIVAADARHVTITRLKIVDGGRARIRERIQIGRSHEHQGFWSGALYADVLGTPLLRHRIEVGAGAVTDDELATPRACVSELRYPDDEFDAPGILLALAGGGCLATWLGSRLAG